MARRQPKEPPADYDHESSVTYSGLSSQSENYGMNSNTRMPSQSERSTTTDDDSYTDDSDGSYTDESYTDSESDSSFEWDDVDALHEPNIIEAMKKFQGHQALQQVMYNSMTVRRKAGRQRVPIVDEVTGQTDFVAPLEYNPDNAEDVDGIQMHPIEVPLGRTVSQFVEAVETKPDVAPIQASSLRDSIVPLSQKRKELLKIREQLGPTLNVLAPRQQASRLKADFDRALENFLHFFKPFRSTLKWIDSHYGADVFSYFGFVLWIMTTNLLTLGVTFFFGMIPSLIWHDGNADKATAVLPRENVSYRAQDILTTGGFMRDSFLHYGFYLSDNKEIFGGWNFDRTLGYLFAVVFFFMFQFIVITYSLANSYGNLVSTTLTGAKSKYCDAVFFLWEHMTRSQEAIAINQVNIKTTLREQLAAVKRQQGFRRILYVRRFIINAGVLGLLVGIAAGIWYLLNNATLAETGGNISESIGLARNLAPVVIITAVNMIMPMAFSWITQLEKYKSYQTQLAMSILKGVLLNLGTIGILYFYWLLEKTGQPLKEAIAVLGNRNCSMPQTVTCWESGLSMRFYQLEIMNLIFELGWTVLIVALVFVQYVSKAKWKPVFPADWLTQRIIYLQIVTWLATYYSPAISGFTLLSTAITVAREVLLIRYTKLYKSAPLGNGSEGTNVIYSAALLASFFAATVCVAFSLTFYMPSHDCGPLRPPFCPQPDVVVAAVRRFSIYSEGLYLIFDTLIMPGMLAFIMLLLLVFIYYYHVKSEAFGELTPVLQNHLALEGKDQIALYLSIVRHQPRRRRRRRRKATTAGNPEDRAQNGAAPHAARSTARRRRAHRDTVVPDAQASSSDALSARTRV